MPSRRAWTSVGAYPSPTKAEAALARRHGVRPEEVIATAGAAEAFSLLARLRPWRKPVVIHPQFTEPDVALAEAGHRPTHVHCAPDDFALDPASVPEDADLVLVGNPTNPTGVLHAADRIRALVRPGRLVVVDEAFIDFVPGEQHSLADLAEPGLVVVRSLTKLWSIPGVRAGYVLATADVVAELRAKQTPWSVSATAAAAMVACAGEEARTEQAPASNSHCRQPGGPGRRAHRTRRTHRGRPGAVRARPGGRRHPPATPRRGLRRPSRRHFPRPRPGLGPDRRPRSRTDPQAARRTPDRAHLRPGPRSGQGLRHSTSVPQPLTLNSLASTPSTAAENDHHHRAGELT